MGFNVQAIVLGGRKTAPDLTFATLVEPKLKALNLNCADLTFTNEKCT